MPGRPGQVYFPFEYYTCLAYLNTGQIPEQQASFSYEFVIHPYRSSINNNNARIDKKFVYCRRGVGKDTIIGPRKIIFSLSLNVDKLLHLENNSP